MHVQQRGALVGQRAQRGELGGQAQQAQLEDEGVVPACGVS